jgi:hypothetical protein
MEFLCHRRLRLQQSCKTNNQKNILSSAEVLTLCNLFSQEFLLIFAAGNLGLEGPTPEANSKNSLAVGASQNSLQSWEEFAAL